MDARFPVTALRTRIAATPRRWAARAWRARRRALGAALSILFLAGPGVAAASTYLEGADSLGQREAAQALARASDRHLLIEVGGDWCAWCKLLERLLQQHADLAAGWHGAFVVLKIAASEDGKPAPALHGLPATDGYPYFYVLDGDGRLLHAADGRVFYVDGDYVAERVGAFIERWGPRLD